MVSDKKQDRRILRTRNALHQALHEIVVEKGYEQVTIEDITSRANLGRTTFYLHYKDKEDLLLEGLEEELTLIIDEIEKKPIGSSLFLIYQMIKENGEIFTLITREQSTQVYERLKTIITNVSLKLIETNPWAKEKTQNLSIPLDYLIEYYSGALWSSIIWWAKTGFEKPVEEMVRNFQMLFFPGMKRALNITNLKAFFEHLY